MSRLWNTDESAARRVGGVAYLLYSSLESGIASEEHGYMTHLNPFSLTSFMAPACSSNQRGVNSAAEDDQVCAER